VTAASRCPAVVASAGVRAVANGVVAGPRELVHEICARVVGPPL
jgi:hypothetical protein